MRSRYFFIRQIVLAFFLCMASGLYAQTTAFTYQGKLTDTGSSATGTYLMEFRLFDAVSSGTQVGSTILNPGVSVTNGIFTVQLDFSSPTPCPTCFNGADRYLEVSVKKNAGDAFTILSPRQKITSAPYAIRSANSANSDLLGGQPPSNYATAAALAAQNTALQAQITQLQADLAATTGGTHLWSKRMGSTTSDVGYSIAVDSSGNVFVTGSFQGTVDFGGGALVSAGLEDNFVAKYSGATGAHIWSKRFGGTLGDIGYGIAVDGSGDVFVTGYFASTSIDFGGGALTNAGNYDIFLAKLSGTNGAHLWSRRFGSTVFDIASGVAVDGSGNVVITGYFTGTVDFGGLPLASAGASNDIFVAKYSGATSSHLWSKRFGGTSGDYGHGVAADSSGNVFVTGYFSSATIDFGGGALTNAGSYDGFLAKLSAADGSHLWSKRFGGTTDDEANSVAVDGSGSVFVTGYFASTSIDFGGGALTNAGSSDVFVAKYNASGVHQWSKALGGTSSDSSYSIALDGSGNAVITGYFALTVNFGGASLNSAGSADIFVAKYAGTDGVHQWSRRFGGTSDDYGQGVAVDSSGDVFVTGYYASPTIDFGGGPLTNAGPAGSADIFVAKLKK